MKLYSVVDNHDVDRIASKLNVPGHIYPVHTLLFYFTRIPSIYYGSEWGIKGRKEGANDDPLRPAVDLKEALKDPDDPKLLEWVKTLGRIHRKQPALSDGRYQELLLTNRQVRFRQDPGRRGRGGRCEQRRESAELCIREPLGGKTYTSLIDGSEGRG